MKTPLVIIIIIVLVIIGFLTFYSQQHETSAQDTQVPSASESAAPAGGEGK